MKKISVLLSFLLLFTQMFVFNNQALAKDLTNQVINDISVVKQDGSSGEFSHRERTKISVSFAGNGTKISTNDTLSVKLPKELVGFNSSIALKNSEGITLGTCNVTNSSIDCTFNDNVEKLDNIRGEFFFEAEINKSEEGTHNVNLDFGNTNITKSITVNNGSASGVESDEIFYKSGQILPDDVGNIQWALRFNNKQDYFRGNDPALISDTLGSGMELNKDSLQLSVKQINEAQPRFYSVEEFENAGLGNVNVNGNNINVRFNTPSYNELMVYYSTEITDNSLKSFENQSSATYIDKNEKQVTENSNAIVQNINSGGKAEGDLAKYSGKVVINKVGNDENGNSKPLEGAEFELVNLNEEVVGKGTTDSSGSLVFDNIKGGTHTLKETKIPSGYKIDETNFPKQVVLDFEKDKEINLNVVNIKEPKTEEPKTEEPKTEEPKTEEPKTEEPKTEEPKTEEPKTEEPKTEEPKTEEQTKVESNKGESITGKSTEEKMNKDHENKNVIEYKDQARNNQSEKVENSTGTPEKSQQKNNEKTKDNGDKGGILPNTGEAIQNHPIITTACILLLLTFGIALVFYRRKQQ
ncbi:SpaA isopeptide-forming pilin-related protein [Mammaliicoccus sp. A-M2]|uniref:SpaA isopeptide-forming pilin-related protein n=1 Tax=Mammaliicoccus sp. A-M2 TaxID=2898662 RepID=UPI001EFBB0CD|nr:SpaA isopeptide-forming pilin-related protein [Mammaliicoccus sp. A-M2]